MKFSILLLSGLPLALSLSTSTLTVTASSQVSSSSANKNSPNVAAASTLTVTRTASSQVSSSSADKNAPNVAAASTITVTATASTGVPVASIASGRSRDSTINAASPNVASSSRAPTSSVAAQKASPTAASSSSRLSSASRAVTSSGSAQKPSAAVASSKASTASSKAASASSAASTGVANIPPAIPPQGSGGVCGGSPNGCWGANYSIETDSEVSWPNTGRTVEYNFTLINTTCSPDGIEKACLLVNNQFPGPTVTANWGDMVKVTINNNLQDNGTSIHWHGLRQLNSNYQDGVNGLTECPIPPGGSKTYIWQATSYGTSWWHSHAATQYGDGVFGPLVINGPTSAGWDIDMGPITVSEIYRQPGASTALDQIITTQGPLLDVPDNILFNGMNVNAAGGGKRLEMTVTPNKRYLMRFINTGVDDMYKVGIDNHTMQVVAIDLQPVKPYTAQYVSLGIGQRFDAVVTMNGTVDNYFLRALPMNCQNNNNNGKGNQTAIIRYAGASKTALPTTVPAVVHDDCLDEPLEKTVPFVAKPVDVTNLKSSLRNLPVASPFKLTSNTEGRVFRWQIGETTQNVDLQHPILQRLVQGNTTISPEDNIIGVDEPNTWAFWYMQNNFYEPHPIHMHGNDLRILASGEGQWDEDVSKLQTENPMRRDTFMLRGGGYAILAFYTDNPGVWLLHCHIGWHVSEGLSTSLYVRKDDIKLDMSQGKEIEEGCTAWNNYLQTPGRTFYQKFGSGV